MIDFSYLEKLENNLGIKFSNHNLLAQALVHRSYLNENPSFHLGHNERLEFLGDAVLELVVSDYLYKNYPDKPEGMLTSWRAALVNADNLSQIADLDLKIGSFVLLSKGESRDVGRARQRILANTLEAVIGAIYLDKGLDIVAEFINKKILTKLPEIIERKLYVDAKSYFQEKSQDVYGITPTYEVLSEWGPDHAKNFKVGVFLDKELIGEGEGHSKQEAQQNAAEKAIKKMGWQ